MDCFTRKLGYITSSTNNAHSLTHTNAGVDQSGSVFFLIQYGDPDEPISSCGTDPVTGSGKFFTNGPYGAFQIALSAVRVIQRPHLTIPTHTPWP